MLGWHTRSFAEIRALHQKPTGVVEGALHDGIKNGRAEYFSGYHPFFMFVKCLKRTAERPYLVGAAGIFYGFFSSWLKGEPRVADQGLIRYIRRQQIRRLLLLDTVWK
jgi:hypothetical protein